MKITKRFLTFIIIFMVFILLGISVFIVYKKNAYKPYYVPESRVEKLNNNDINITDTVGWIQTQGTNIDYPVVYENPIIYHSGIDYIWVSNNYVSGQNRMAIFGHNILNISNQPLINAEGHTRFETLMDYVYYGFAMENLYITYTHDGKDHLYKIYAVGFVYSSDERGYGINKDNSKAIDEYIEETRNNSLYKYDIDVNSSDNLISLITCTRYFGLTGKSDFRVDAREVRKNEKIDKYSVETTKNYDIIK